MLALEAVLEVVLGYTGRQLATAARTDARITVGRILEVVVDGENGDRGLCLCGISNRH